MTHHEAIVKAFRLMGARVQIDLAARRDLGQSDLTLDVREDRRGEYFQIALSDPRRTDVCVLDVRPRLRHLVLGRLIVSAADKVKVTRRFLCGHDEREWFIAALPGDQRVTTVLQAMEALKPKIVRDSQARHGVRTDERNRRRNDGFVRQGEWFFVPQPDLDITGLVVHHDEPLVRGRGKPHMADELVRQGGVQVHFSQRYPNGLTDDQYKRLVVIDPRAADFRWHLGVRNPEAYVRGSIRHPDHRTVVLTSWHRVVPNTEAEAPGRPHVAFID